MMESMDDKKSDATAEKEVQQKRADAVGSAISLGFPTAPQQDPTPHLGPLRDKHSGYPAVAKVCLQLNQFALNGSSSALDDVHSGVSHSMLIHDQSLAASLSEAFSSLTNCLQNHGDRRAKILACKTLALVARATYAKMRHSPQLYAIRDSKNARLEDEVGTDIPMTLVGCALEDLDDGVAASALQALGTLVLSSGATTGTLVEEELWRELSSLVQQRTSPFAPSLSDLEDEESYIPQVVLQTRILENVIGPRLLQLVSRAAAFGQSRHVGMILPVLTSALVHLSKTTVTLYALNREAYTKRWVEMDYVSLTNTVAQTILLPAMDSGQGQLAHAAAMSAIRLAHACPHSSWAGKVTSMATIVLKEELCFSSVSALSGSADNGPSLEALMTNLGALIICARSIPLPARASLLGFCFDKVRSLPSTTMAPHGIHSAGLLLEAHGSWQYRRPSRVGLLTEIALSFFMDGPIDSSSGIKNPRSNGLDTFLKSNDVLSAIKEVQTGKVSQFREELALTFCSVAVSVGRRHKGGPQTPVEPYEEDDYQSIVAREDFSEWVRMSLLVINTFNSCLGWGAAPKSYMEEDVSLLTATQTSYAHLVQELSHAVGLLPSTSVSLKIGPGAAPSTVLWDQLEESAAFLGHFDSQPLHNPTLLEKIGKAMDAFAKKEMKGNGMSSHHLRHFLLTIAADVWVQGKYLATRREFDGKGSGSSAMALGGVSDLLQALSPRRIFAKVVEHHKSQIESYPKKKKESYKKHAQDTLTVCVACVENIALAASDWRKRFGNSSEVKEIYNMAIASLEGKVPGVEGDSSGPILPVCQGAIERIQAAFASNDQPNLDHLSLSPLLLNAPDLRRRPVITSSKAENPSDVFNEGYLTQLTKLIIAVRTDQCILSLPALASLRGATRRQNWLRLTLPPLPPSRNPQSPTSALPKFSWGSGICSSSAGSDAAATTLAYSIRRNMRYDGEDEFRLAVLMRVYNITPVEVPEGLRLAVGVSQESAATSLDGQDDISIDILRSLTEGNKEFKNEAALSSAFALYKQELPSGEQLTWEVMLDPLPMAGSLTLHPSIEYRALEDEVPNTAWLRTDTRDDEKDDTSATSGVSSHSLGNKGSGDNKDQELKRNILIPGQEMRLSPMVGLQPCPLVFFRDGCGDTEAFRYLWTNMPHQIPPLALVADHMKESDSTSITLDTRRLAALATVKFAGNAIPGGEVTRLWAFSSLTGKRALFVLAESEGEGKRRVSSGMTLHIRGDDEQLLCCLAGTLSSRKALVGTLLPGLTSR